MRSQFFQLCTVPLIAFLVILASSCDDGTRKHRRDDFTRPTYTTSPPSDQYFRLNPDCQAPSDPVPLAEGEVFSLLGQDSVTEKVDLNGLELAPSLRSKIIAKTVVGGHYVRHCPRPLGNLPWCYNVNQRPIGWRQAEAPNLLSLCTIDKLERFSHEGIALTSAFFLQKAFRQIQQFLPDQYLEQITLHVLPSFTTIYSGKTWENGESFDQHEYLTDNLSYFPNQKIIAVHPQSEQAVSNGMKPFWESAFAMAHEFGHHLEHAILDRKLENLGWRWDPRHHRYIDVQSQANRSDQTTIWTAISEGFADLIAFYSEESSNLSLVGLGNLGQDRDPSRSVFSDGQTPKVLNKQHIMAMLSGEPASSTRVPVHHPHLYGAMIAHGLNQFFKTISAWQGGDMFANELAKPAHQFQLSALWLKHVADYLLDEATSRQQRTSDMPYLTLALHETVTTYLKSMTVSASEKRQLFDRLCMQHNDYWPSVAKPAYCS